MPAGENFRSWPCSVSSSLLRIQNADRQDDRLEAVELEPPLDCIRSLVVEKSVIPLLFLEDELPEEKDGLRKFFDDFEADLMSRVDGFRSDPHPVVGAHTV